MIVELEDINFIKVSISLSIGDEIVESLSSKWKIVYIDYICEIVVVASENGNTDVFNFNDVAWHFRRVVK